MAFDDYTPVYVPGDALSLSASAAVHAGDVVEVTGPGTVARVSASASLKVAGVASADARPGERVMVWGRGTVHELIADGEITAGDLVVASVTAGAGIRTMTGDDDTRALLGVAITSAASGTFARWMET